MIHLYHGDGKGKTTAAMGLALRMLAAGRRVVIVQFLKDGQSGEARMLAERLGAALYAGKASENRHDGQDRDGRRDRLGADLL